MPQREGYVRFIMGIVSRNDVRGSMGDDWQILRNLCPVTHFDATSNYSSALWKMNRKLPRISPPQPPPSPPLPSRSRYSTHLPSLAPRPAVPYLTPQRHSPPSSFPTLKSASRARHPPLNASLTSSSSALPRPTTSRPVHRGPPSHLPSVYTPKPPPRPPC